MTNQNRKMLLRFICRNHIIIPQGCKRIEAKAFSNCDDLEYIFIPDSVDFVAEDAFDGCLKVVIDKQGQ